jgi:hypothetical protein
MTDCRSAPAAAALASLYSSVLRSIEHEIATLASALMLRTELLGEQEPEQSMRSMRPIVDAMRGLRSAVSLLHPDVPAPLFGGRPPIARYAWRDQVMALARSTLPRGLILEWQLSDGALSHDDAHRATLVVLSVLEALRTAAGSAATTLTIRDTSASTVQLIVSPCTRQMVSMLADRWQAVLAGGNADASVIDDTEPRCVVTVPVTDIPGPASTVASVATTHARTPSNSPASSLSP